MDIELHVPQGFGSELRDWFATGQADVALMDRAVREVLTAKSRMGLSENPFAPVADEREGAFVPGDSVVALGYARESLVLLKNNGALPLRKSVRKLAVIGCHAASARFFLGGYSFTRWLKASVL
ncbi:hypothetical protein [Arthrobacter sp. M4]|uniref:hypothetical protein n=1 Tax=Arthrobacter sp. M4 TaxID=218160 RepID=UPI001CDC1ACC|nr:hypothetical protein [Arthrobacter sp. M4]MCA4132580.1 hypothetical protein [Arthrobacter sp. M4]